jgi:cytochrome c551/c552
MFRSIKQWCIGALTAVVVLGAFDVSAQPNGEALFKAKCNTCHQPHADGTGPKLFGVRQKWADGGAQEGSIYKWVANWKAAAAADPYAMSVSKVKPSDMQTFPDLDGKVEEINAIFDYIDAQPDPATVTGGGDGASAEGAAGMEEEEEGGLSWIWIIIGLMFVVVIMAVGGVRRQLNNAGKDAADEKSYGEEFKTWAWKNRKYVGLGGLVIVIALIVNLFLAGYSIGVVENYQPSQPIAFPHDIHTGTNGIDCKYCHNSVTKSKSAGLPTVNVCMNCHKQIKGRTPAQAEKITAIYEAAGWDGNQYTGKTSPIVWNKVHVLPDHVYFNHSQHVVVGGLDCKQCHGDMTKQNETARVVPVSELNQVEGNIPLTKATLTMGWCIECHGEKEVSEGALDTKGSGYYDEIHKRLLNNDKKLYGKYLEDGKVTVKELGGWECAKCHY